MRTALAAGTDGSLWVGTTAGLVHYSNKKFRNYNWRRTLRHLIRHLCRTIRARFGSSPEEFFRALMEIG
jgi:ligand-binding sensor domain-containing protein